MSLGFDVWALLWGEKLISGGLVILVTKGSTTGPRQPVLTWVTLEVGQWVAWISANWWYILSTPSGVGEGEAFGDLAASTSI
jgi:hypothetical protein